MPIVNVDLSKLSTIDPGVTNLKNARIDFSPYRAFADAATWVTRDIERVSAPDGVASPFLLPTPAGNAFEVQERGFRGARHGYVLVPDVETVDYVDLVWVDKDTLEPSADPEAAWWAAAGDAIAAAPVAAQAAVEAGASASAAGVSAAEALTRAEAAEGSAAAAQGALVDSAAFVGSEIATDGTPAASSVAARIATQLDDENIPGQVSAAVAAAPTVAEAAASAVAGAVSVGAYKAAFIDGLAVSTNTELLRNEFTNPDADGPTNIISAASITVAPISTDTFTGWPSSGTKSFKFTVQSVSSGITGATVPQALRPAAAPGQVWSVGFDVYNPQSASRTFRGGFLAYTADLSAIGAPVMGGAVTVPANGKARVHYTTPAMPTGTATFRPYFSPLMSGGAVAGDVFYLDAIDIYKGNEPRAYLAGSQPNAYWTGTAGASASAGVVVDVGAVQVNEGPLLFTDPRVGGIASADPGSLVDNGPAFDAAWGLLSNGGEMLIPPGIWPVRTAPSGTPGGVLVRGEGSSTPYPPAIDGEARPTKGTIIKATAAISHAFRLGHGTGLAGAGSEGHTGDTLRDLLIDGNNLADSALWTNGNRQHMEQVHVYSGAVRGWLGESQNMEARNCYFIQDTSGTNGVHLRGGIGQGDNKIWQCQVAVVGSAGSAVIIEGVGGTTVEQCHLWIKKSLPPTGDRALLELRNAATTSAYDTRIVGNTIESGLCDEIAIYGDTGRITGLLIEANTFYQIYTAEDGLTDNAFSVVRFMGGKVSTIGIQGNTVRGVAAELRYKAMVRFEAGVTESGGILIDGNTGRFVTSLTSGTPPTVPVIGQNVLHNGAAWSRTQNGGDVNLTGDGVKTAFTILHGLVAAPREKTVVPGSAAAAAPFYVTSDTTNLTVTYTTPPANGAGLALNWRAAV